MTSRRKSVLTAEIDMANVYKDISGGLIVILNPSGEVIEINRHGAEILGYPVNQIIGRNWFQVFVPEKVRGDLISRFQGLLTEISVDSDFENPILTRDGRELGMFWHSRLLHDKRGGLLGMSLHGESLSLKPGTSESRKKYRERLETSIAEGAARYSRASSQLGIAQLQRDLAEKGLQLRAMMLDNLPEPIFLIDLKGNLVYVNEAAPRIFEFDRHKMLGISFWELVQPQSKDIVEQSLRNLQQKHETIYETYYVGKNGARINVQVHSVTLPTSEGTYILSLIHTTQT